MFYLGVKYDESSDSGIFVLIEKSLKKMKKHYSLISVERFSSGKAEIEKEIIRVYNNRKYIIRKRVFSQDKRPPKNVRVYPSILFEFKNKNTDQIDALRKKKIPVEGISPYNKINWQKQEYGRICLGNNYFVPKNDLIKNLLKVLKEKRLITEQETASAENLTGKLACLEAELNKGDDWPENDVISALSMPVWFCETIRFIRRY